MAPPACPLLTDESIASLLLPRPCLSCYRSVNLPVCLFTRVLVCPAVCAGVLSRAEDPGFNSRLRRDCSGSSHTSDFKIGSPVATLPGTWRDRVNAGTS